MTNSEAYIVLNLLPGIGPGRVRGLLEVFDSPQAILGQPVDRLVRAPGIGQKHASTLHGWRQHVDLDRELNVADRAGVRLIPRDDPDYPELLAEIPDPPLVLYVRGNTNALHRVSQLGLAVVGSRRTTRYGEDMTRRLVASAVHSGWIVVSGLARGTDTQAHQTTVDNDGVTIAVLAGGLGQIYPPENVELARRITEKGALVSEQPMLMKPDKRSFPMRNRIISGLSRGTLVIEAGTTSGALITAELALDQGRGVYALPGRVDSPQSHGCHRLIKEGAKLVETIDDVLDDFSFLPGFEMFETADDDQAPTAASPRPPSPIELDPVERAIVGALERGDLDINELVRITGEPASVLLAQLAMMELKRLVRQLPGHRYELYTKS